MEVLAFGTRTRLFCSPSVHHKTTKSIHIFFQSDFFFLGSMRFDIHCFGSIFMQVIRVSFNQYKKKTAWNLTILLLLFISIFLLSRFGFRTIIFGSESAGNDKTVLSAQGEDFTQDAFWNLNRKIAHSHWNKSQRGFFFLFFFFRIVYQLNIAERNSLQHINSGRSYAQLGSYILTLSTCYQF